MITIVTLVTSQAAAEEDPLSQMDPKMEAKRLLLKEAEPLLQQGRYNDALHKIEQSLKLYRSPRTLHRKASCLYALQRYLETKRVSQQAHELALSEEKKALEQDNDARAESLKALAQRAETLADKASAHLVRLTILVPSSAAAQGTEIQYQRILRAESSPAPQILLKPKAYNRPIELDPGHYRIVANAPQMEAWGVDVYLTGKRQQLTVTIPALAAAVSLNAEADTSLSTARTAAVWLGVVGTSALVAGAVLGAYTATIDSDASARQFTAVSLVSLGVGAATVAVAGMLWLGEEPDKAGASLALSPTSATLQLRF